MHCTTTGSSDECNTSKSEGHTLLTNSFGMIAVYSVGSSDECSLCASLETHLLTIPLTNSSGMIAVYTVGSSDECSLCASLETHLLTNTSGGTGSSDAHPAPDHPVTSASSHRRWSPSSGHSPDRPMGTYFPRRIIRRMLDCATFF